MERPTLDEMLIEVYKFLLDEFTDPHAVAPIKFKAFALQTSPGILQAIQDADMALLEAKSNPQPEAHQSEPAYAPGHQPKPGQRAADVYRGHARVLNPNGESKSLERKPTVPLHLDSPFRRLGEVVLPNPQQQAGSLIESTGLQTTSQGTQTTGVQVADKPLTDQQKAKLATKVVAAGNATMEEANAALGVNMPSVSENDGTETEEAYQKRIEAETLPTLTDDDLAEIIAMNPKSVTEAYDPNRLRAYLAENEIPFKDTASDRQVAGALITWLKTRPSAK